LARSLIALLLTVLLPCTARAEEPVTLNFWIGASPSLPMSIEEQKQIALFEKAHPNINIATQYIVYGPLHDKLLTAIAGGDAPDVSWGLIEWFGELSRMGALRDMTPLVEQWPDKDKIYPTVWKALTIDGRVLAMPHYLGLRALLYHEDMLQQTGIAAPPKTWDELLADCKIIKEKTGKFGFGIAGTGVRAPQELIAYLAQNNVAIAVEKGNGKYRNTWDDNPAELERAAEVFAFYKQLKDSGAISPDASGWGYQEEDTNFSLGQYAMAIDGPWMQNYALQNPQTMADVKIVPPPAKLSAATFFEINPFYVLKVSKHPEEQWEFVQFLAGKQYQKAVRPDNSPRSDVISDSKWSKDFVGLTSIGVFFPPVALGQITQNMQDSIGRVLLRNEEPATVAAWLGNAINRDLRQAGQLGAK
jgi:ABC-type glycerol-3-phosphate transport system substrate-binding protein